MAITVAEYESLLDQAQIALGAGNYSLARVCSARARLVLAGLADYTIGDRSARYTARLDDFDKVLATLQQEADADSGSAPSVTFARCERE